MRRFWNWVKSFWEPIKYEEVEALVVTKKGEEFFARLLSEDPLVRATAQEEIKQALRECRHPVCTCSYQELEKLGCHCETMKAWIAQRGV